MLDGTQRPGPGADLHEMLSNITLAISSMLAYRKPKIEIRSYNGNAEKQRGGGRIGRAI